MRKNRGPHPLKRLQSSPSRLIANRIFIDNFIKNIDIPSLLTDLPKEFFNTFIPLPIILEIRTLISDG
jgi:hypothetical protein